MERLRSLAFFGCVVIWNYGMVEPPSRFMQRLTRKLAHWLSHSAIFGSNDKFIEDLTEAWCIAKIGRLVGPIEPPIDSKYEEEFAVAEYLESNTFRHPTDGLERPFITVGTLRQRLESITAPKVSPELLDFIDFLLIVDHTKRPTAEEALQHPYLLEEAISTT